MSDKRKSKRKIRKKSIDGMFKFFNDDIRNLYEAIEKADFDNCALLLKKGINPNSMYKDFSLLYWIFVFMQKADSFKIKDKYTGIYKLFLLFNVNINQLIYYTYVYVNEKIRVANYIPLISIFSILNLPEYVELLLENPETNINFIDSKGNTPLIYAASNGCKDIVKLLASDKRINLLVQNNDYTASDYARFNKHYDIQKYLFNIMREEINKILSKIDGFNFKMPQF